MEKCVDSEYIQSEHDVPKSSNTKNCSKCFFSNSTEEKTKCKACGKVSRVRKKIASKKRSSGRSNTENVTTKKSKTNFSKTKLNVLKKLATDAERKSVQKKTKIIQRNVPDRLGKYVSSSNRSETKLLVGDFKLETKSSPKECSSEGNSKPSEGHSLLDNMSNECTETKLSLLGKECLSKEEAVSLRNSIESDLETKNIFEKFFDDCLDSTSKGNEVSSQEISNIDESGKSLKSANDDKASNSLEEKECIDKIEKRDDSEVTPAKKKTDKKPPPTPVKIKDHSNYYSSHKNIRHVCNYCQKIFKSNGKLNSHVYSHTGERPFDCNHCGKAFSSKFKLVRHLLIHSEIRKFVCQICDRTFLRNDHLKNHYKVHDPQKKMYKCPKENCDKQYSSMMSHKKHMAYHNVEDGDLKCLICNVKFETKEEVLFHLKSHSGSRLFKSQSDKKFKCEFCDRLFLTRKDVTRHLVVHTGERDFLCQFCPQRFGRKDHLVRHIKKSHGNEDLTLKSEENKQVKEDVRKPEEGKPKLHEKSSKKSSKEDTSTVCVKPSKSADVQPCVISTDSITKENNTQTNECSNKTHIVITVQEKSVKNSSQTRKRKICDNGNKNKSFQRNESLVPMKKQVPLAKGKNSTTQILLQNIPNILIIPNNSIILLRNQSGTSKNLKGEDVTDGSKPPEPMFRVPETGTPEMRENLMSPPQEAHYGSTPDGNGDFPANFGYDATMLQPPSHFLEGFGDNDNFCNFQSDFASFGSQFEDSEQLNFEMLNQGDLLPRPEVCLTTGSTPIQGMRDGDLLTEASRQIKLLETGINVKSGSEKPENDMGKGFFEEGNESLMLNESILNEFKDESSGILPTDNDIGIINNLLNQTNDNCGFEILRNLLTTENPSLSPLPGFSQIFNNSNNTNSS